LIGPAYRSFGQRTPDTTRPRPLSGGACLVEETLVDPISTHHDAARRSESLFWS